MNWCKLAFITAAIAFVFATGNPHITEIDRSEWEKMDYRGVDYAPSEGFKITPRTYHQVDLPEDAACSNDKITVQIEVVNNVPGEQRTQTRNLTVAESPVTCFVERDYTTKHLDIYGYTVPWGVRQ